MKTIRPRITSQEFDILKEIRTQHKALARECQEQGLPVHDVKHYWFKGKNFSIFSKPSQKSYDDVRDSIVSEMKKHAPIYPKLEYAKHKEGHLLIIDPADIHFGKLAVAYESGDNYNIKTARKRVLQGVSGLISKAQGFEIDQILFVIGNDILHIDNPHRKTTAGTPQDTDGMWFDAFLKAKETIVSVIEMLIPIAPVRVQYDPSNHDYMSGFYFADTINSWFHKCESVTFNTSISHRKYYKYGSSLIGTTHGDGAKVGELPLLMAQESANDWSETKHRYFYIHHLHHKIKNDHIGVTVESLRSPSGTESWHHRNGYQHAPKAIEAFIHSKDHGQIARLTHIF